MKSLVGAIRFLLPAAFATGWLLLAWRLMVFWKPWRGEEAGMVLTVAIPAGVLVSWLVSSRRRWFQLWVAGLTLGWLVVLGSALALYRHHRSIGLPTLPQLSRNQQPQPIWTVARAVADPSGPLALVRPFPMVSPEPALLADSVLAGFRVETRWRPLRDEHPTAVLRRHSLLTTDILLDAFEATADPRYLQAAERLVLDWISANSGYLFAPPSRFSWGDHATALRLTRLLRFFQVWRDSPLATSSERTRVVRSIIGHGRILSDSAFYTAAHNHGVDQDIAIIQAAVMLPNLPEAGEWFRTGSHRLQSTLNLMMSPNGAWKEHSPGYHLTTLLHLAEFAAFLRQAGRDAETPWLEPLIDRMAGFLPHFVEPDGTLVSFGDTSVGTGIRSRLLLQRLAVRTPLLRAVLAGADGETVGRVRFFPEEGYVFLRDPVNAGPVAADAWYVAITAASYRGRGHKHCDGLSLVATGLGRRFLIDPGAYGYLADRWRRYFVSCEAHNSVTIGTSQDTIPIFPTGNGNSRLDEVQEAGDLILVNGQQTLGRYHHHRRVILWIRNHGVVIADVLAANPPADLPSGSRLWPRQLLHFGPDIEIRMEGVGHARLHDRNSGTQLGTALQHVASVRWETASGSTDPLLGWQAVGGKNVARIEVLAASLDSVAGTFVTELILAPGAFQQTDRPAAVSQVRVSGDTAEVILQVRGESWRLRIDPTAADLEPIPPRPRQ